MIWQFVTAVREATGVATRNLFKDAEEATNGFLHSCLSARRRLVLRSTPCCRRFRRQHHYGYGVWQDRRRGLSMLLASHVQRFSLIGALYLSHQ